MAMQGRRSIKGLAAVVLAVAGWSSALLAVAASPASEMRDVKLAAVAHMRELESLSRAGTTAVDEMRDVKLAAVAHMRAVETSQRVWTPAEEMRELKALARAHEARLQRLRSLQAAR